MIPNAITAMALCLGLTGVRFAIGTEWEKALAAMIRAGHPFALAREITALVPGSSIDLAELTERFGVRR